MTQGEIKDIVLKELVSIAPELEGEDIDWHRLLALVKRQNRLTCQYHNYTASRQESVTL